MAQHTKKSLPRRQAGQLIVELLIAFGLASILLPALVGGFVAATKGREVYEQRIAAIGLLRETEEAVRSVREAGWSSVATNGTYYPKISGNGWSLSSNAGDASINGFTRSIAISDYAKNNIVDPSIKKIVITVSWPGIITRSVVSTLFVSRYLGNTTWFQTTDIDFNAGTLTNTTVTKQDDGEVQLGAGGLADWCAPDPNKIVQFNLDKSGVANAISAIEGRVFAGTGDNASGPAFDNVGISLTTPPVPTLLGNFGSNPIKTNGIFGETNYAYLATDTNRSQGVIVDLTTLTNGQYSQIGSLDIGVSSTNGESIYVANNIAYLSGSNGKLYAFNILTRSGTHSPIASVDLGATANKIVVVGSNIYAAINATTNQLKIIPLTGGGTGFGTPVSITVTGQFGRDIFENASGTRAYLATSTSASQNEFFIIDTNPQSASYKQTKGSYDTSGMDPKGVTVVAGNKAIIVGTGGTQQYQVIDITNEGIPVHCTSGGRSGGITIATGVNGISSVLLSTGDAYSYIITGDATAELKIIPGGPGGKFSTNGNFISSTFDAGHDVAFNNFLANIALPPGVVTNITYQVAGAAAVSGSCVGANFNFIGPDMTASTYFATSSAIPVGTSGTYINPGRCFKYKVYLTTQDPTYSPSFNDIRVNYSP